ncbi:MAG: hypothetical protein ABSG63_14200 [Spirochaetia bacterium]|jgi:hypothetical protein
MLLLWRGTGTSYTELIRTEETKNLPKTRRDMILLSPGVNEIGDDEWALAKPHLESVLKSGQLREIRPAASALKSVEGKLPAARGIADLSEKDALIMIEKVGIPLRSDKDGNPTFIPEVGNRDTLYRWMVEDPRNAVQAAILARLATLHLSMPTAEELEKASYVAGVDDGAA